MQNVIRRISVPVMERAAGGAGPAPDLRILSTRIPGTTDRAELSGWEEPADRDQLATVFVAFIANLTLKLVPSGVFDSVMAIFVLSHHGWMIKAFHANYVIFVNQSGSYLMYRILPPVI